MNRSHLHCVEEQSPLTREELLAELLGYHGDEGDCEGQHMSADAALLRYINDPAITEAYLEINAYYQ